MLSKCKGGIANTGITSLSEVEQEDPKLLRLSTRYIKPSCTVLALLAN